MITTNDLIKKYATEKNITLKESKEQVNGVLDTLMDLVVEEESVTIIGKFTLQVITRGATSGELNGRTYTSPEKKKLKIKTGAKMNARLNKLD